ncbi:MAG TPA: Hsp33 family molecular chaperone [Aestuariivirgaceae bacterium]|nr:Hsp33 family molecular chaperone [Aestuariivirgaceae bacterium]
MNEAPDDLVQAFEVRPLGVRGRVVRLGATVDDILHRHDYPAAVSALLGEAIALTAMLGSALKFEGKFILQAKGDGPVDMLVSDYSTPGSMRGYARFDAAVNNLGPGDMSAGSLLGTGHLAMTIDQGADMERYQGIVPLHGGSLGDAAHEYFLRSEQIPTRLMLAAGPLISRGKEAREVWRAGGILVQHLPSSGPPSPLSLSSGDAPQGMIESHPEDDRWVEARLLVDTVEDHELLDPTITPERLLYRLFHQRGVRVFPAQPVSSRCTCSRERIAAVLRGFSAAEREEMREGDLIKVTCEFCSTSYSFKPDDIEATG